MRKKEEISRVIAGQFAGVDHSTNIDEDNAQLAFIKLSAIEEFQLIFETFYYYAKMNKNNYSIVVCPGSTVSSYSWKETNATICINGGINKNAEKQYKHFAIALNQASDELKSRKLCTQSTLFGISLFLLRFIINDDAKNILGALAKEIISEQEQSAELPEWILAVDILDDYKKIKNNTEQEINKAMICIANISQLIYLHQSTNQLNIKYPIMMKYYQEVFLPACQQYINVKEQEYTYLCYLEKFDEKKTDSIVTGFSIFAEDKNKRLSNISQDCKMDIDLSQYDIRWPYIGTNTK